MGNGFEEPDRGQKQLHRDLLVGHCVKLFKNSKIQFSIDKPHTPWKTGQAFRKQNQNQNQNHSHRELTNILFYGRQRPLNQQIQKLRSYIVIGCPTKLFVQFMRGHFNQKHVSTIWAVVDIADIPNPGGNISILR